MPAPALFAALAVTSLQAPPGATPEAPAEAPALDHEIPTRSAARRSAADEQHATWARERRRLQIHTGLSGGFASAMVLTGVLLLVVPETCSNPSADFGCGEGIARYIVGAVLLPLATIPISTSIYWGVRLHRHDRREPVAVLRPGPGGFVLRF